MPDTNLGWDRLPMDPPVTADDRADVQPDQPQPGFTQAAAGPPTWDPGDDADLQSLMYGKSQARKKFRSGEWGQDTFASMDGQLDREIGPLQQRKQAAEQFQQGQATQAALHANAMQNGVRLHDMQMQAQAIPGMLHYEMTPHGPMVFYPDGKGGISQADVPEAPQQEAPTSEGGPPGAVEGGTEGSGENAPVGPDGLPLTDQPRFRTVMDQTGVPHQQRIPTVAEHDAAVQGAATYPGHQVVQNGPYQDVLDNGRMVSTNRPPPPQATGSSKFTPSGEQLAAYQTAARAAVAGIANPRYREQEYARIMGTMVHGHVTNAIHRADEEGRATAAEKSVAAKERLAQQKKDSMEHKSIWDVNFKDHMKELNAESDKYRAKDAQGHTKVPMPEGGLPDYLNDRLAMEHEAEQRADRDFVRAYGKDKLPETRKQAAQPASPQGQPTTPPQGGPAQPQLPPAPKSVEEARARDARAAEEEKKRAQQRQARPTFHVPPGMGGEGGKF